MKKIFIKSMLLFLSIPLINSIAFGLASLVHEMHYSSISTGQYEAYQQSMVLLVTAVSCSILFLESLNYLFLKNNKITTLSYLTFFVILAILTKDQFVFRPYEHSLTFLSITSVIFSRIWLHNRLFRKEIIKPTIIP